MLRLRTFGGVSLAGEGGSIAVERWQRQALLVLLADKGAGGIDRDEVCRLVWPDALKPSQSLNQMLFEMRHAGLGEELFSNGGNMLRLNPACVVADVWEFAAARKAAQRERAVELYAGPFGGSLSESSKVPDQLQRWLSATRRGYARDYARTVEELVKAAASRGDHLAATGWWERLVKQDPGDDVLIATVAEALIKALVDAGKSAEALRFARDYEPLVGSDFHRPPHAAIASWVSRLEHALKPPEVHTDPAGPSVPPPPAPSDGVLPRLRRAVGQRYMVDDTGVEKGSVVTSYPALRTEHGGQRVTIHVIKPPLATSASPERFFAMLGRAATLTDPRILPTLDHGAGEGILFYVTARRLGQTLKDRLAPRAPLPIGEAVRIARDVAHALAHAHEHDVRHLDLRPKHVSLTSTGAMVASFGVIEGVTSDPEPGTTSTAVIVGDTDYLGPERFDGAGRSDARSDVFAFGCILYAMLVGQPPVRFWQGKWQAGCDLRDRRETVPEALVGVVQRCLARLPADRYPSGAALVHALAEVEPSGER